MLIQFLLSVCKVIVRLRANKHLSSLGEFVTDWRKGKFTREHTSKRLLFLDFCYLGIRIGTLNFSFACVAVFLYLSQAEIEQVSEKAGERRSAHLVCAKNWGKVGKGGSQKEEPILALAGSFVPFA